MKLKFFTYYYDLSKVECIIPCPSSKYNCYYFTNNPTMYNNITIHNNATIVRWIKRLDISLNKPFDPIEYQIFTKDIDLTMPFNPIQYEQLKNEYYKLPKITTQYNIINNPQYYVDLSDADYVCCINYKTYVIDEQFVENFVLNYFIKTTQYCIFYKRYDDGMEILIKNLRHREINKKMLLLNEILCKDKHTYLL